jgi:hypothetical protein
MACVEEPRILLAPSGHMAWVVVEKIDAAHHAD